MSSNAIWNWNYETWKRSSQPGRRSSGLGFGHSFAALPCDLYSIATSAFRAIQGRVGGADQLTDGSTMRRINGYPERHGDWRNRDTVALLPMQLGHLFRHHRA